jgi:hypothetical protein
VDEDFPGGPHPLRINIHHNALAAEATGCFPHELRVFAGRRVNRDLVAPRIEQAADVVGRADAAADGQRHEHLLGSAADHVEHDLAPFVAGGNVQKHQLVGPFCLIAGSHFNWIARVTQMHEVGSLYDTAPIDVEAGNHTLGKHREQSICGCSGESKRPCQSK